MAERDLTTADVVDLSTLAGAELPALAALAALERNALAVYERAALHYGLGDYAGMDHTIPVLRLLLATIEEIGRHERESLRGE